MGHIALYREWRPKTFDEVVEQKHTVAALKQAVISGNIAHAYLFSGTRGTGKTTMAQVFSRAINCIDPQNGNPCNKCHICTGILNGSILDVIEMDAASNNSVDTIRRLCDEIIFTPSIAKFKVYIIDEVHMLSTGAFNALLKTLEEPPSHAVFILATTEQHRIPATIVSRCQRYEFRRIPIESIVARLSQIAKSDGVDIKQDALKTIAQMADGALRDAISLLDQAKGSFQKTIEKEDILSLVGVVNDEFMNEMASSIVDCNPAKMLALVEEFILDGRDVIRFTIDLASYFRNVMICKVSKNPEDLVYAPSKTIEEIKSIARRQTLEEITNIIRELSSLVSDLKWSLNTRITFEIAMIRLMDRDKISQIDESDNNKQTTKSVSVKQEIVDSVLVESNKPKKSNEGVNNKSAEEAVIAKPIEKPSALNYEDNDFLSLSSESTGSIIFNQDELPDPFYTSQNTDAPTEEKKQIATVDDINQVVEVKNDAKDEFNLSSNNETNTDAKGKVILSSIEEAFVDVNTEVKSYANIQSNVEVKVDAKDEFNLSSIIETNTDAKGKVTLSSIEEAFVDFKAEDKAETNIQSNVEVKVDANVETKVENKVENKPKISINELWPKILDEIVAMGQMTIYLFLLAAKPFAEENVLKIVFNDEDHVNYKEISVHQNYQIIKQSVFKVAGSDIEILVLLKSQANTTNAKGKNNSNSNSNSNGDNNKQNNLENSNQNSNPVGVSLNPNGSNSDSTNASIGGFINNSDNNSSNGAHKEIIINNPDINDSQIRNFNDINETNNANGFEHQIDKGNSQTLSGVDLLKNTADKLGISYYKEE